MSSGSEGRARLGGGPPGEGRPPAGLRKPIDGLASQGSITRASVRHSNPGGRYSRGSVRASVRAPGGASGGLSGLSVLGGQERIQVVDEEGRDRTPRPLLAARPYAQGGGAPAEGSSLWSSEGPGTEFTSGSVSERAAALPAAALGLDSLLGFNLLADMPAAPAPGHQAQLLLPHALPSSGNKPSDGAAASRPEQQRAEVVRRARAAQRSVPSATDRACQALPWELAADSTRDRQHDEEGAGLAPSTASLEPAAAAAAAGAEGGEEGSKEQEEALQASGLGLEASFRPLSRSDSRLRTESPLDRTSRAGSTSRQDHSRRSSLAQQGEMSERGSITRSSMVTFIQEGSMVGSFMGGSAARTSSMAPSHRPHAAAAVPVLTASEAAALATKRAKAEQQRALARLANIEAGLRSVEAMVAQNAHQDMMAQAQHVQLCSGGEAEGAAEAGAADSVDATGQEVAALAAAPAVAAGMAAAGKQEQQGPGRSLAPTPLPGAPGAAVASQGGPQELWQWKGEAAAEVPASCMAWNKASPELLAVGFGQLEYSVAAKGAVAFYSLRNPAQPLWQFSTPCCVSALDWRGGSLAVGMFDGSVAVYDVRSRAATPTARVPPTGPDGSGGHSEPVWSIRYVGGGSTSAGGAEAAAATPSEELLVSVSTDGRVVQWKHAQLDHVELMQLKRSSSGVAAKQGGAQTDGLLGRAAGATCFDFSPSDPRIYLVGTEDGLLHKCSTAFTEQSIQTYSGHSAPIYQVRWCPFRPGCFLTASADWTLRLWSEAQPASLWTFQLASSKQEVYDAAWCPANATVFAATAGNTLQLWDLEHSVVKPRFSLTRYGVRLTCLAFCPGDAPVLAVGADDGSVAVYSLAALARHHADTEAEAARLEAALQASVLQQLAS